MAEINVIILQSDQVYLYEVSFLLCILCWMVGYTEVGHTKQCVVNLQKNIRRLSNHNALPGAPKKPLIVTRYTTQATTPCPCQFPFLVH